MKCAACGGPMIVLELAGIEIDNCPACKGIWLDSGELELLLEETGWEDKVLNSFFPDSGNREKKRRCPICSKKMDKVFYAGESRVLIDKCSNGCGLWFDENELHQVIEASSIDKNNKILVLLRDIFQAKQSPGK
ncbi:MAG: zf-TFIIB domain-containing protein [Candidatus Omnitrophica bacterium]|nr:zf-TFIIB domain-containing protein [Candidatus Omnitrophota bacterium]MDD5430142.1 zf-TFIIB domain-containing protein [Candidatus Omnitrophota bacterium]